MHFLGRYGDEATPYRQAAQLDAARPCAARQPAITATSQEVGSRPECGHRTGVADELVDATHPVAVEGEKQAPQRSIGAHLAVLQCWLAQ